MRNWLRRWLGLDDLERRTAVVEHLSNSAKGQADAVFRGLKDHLLDHDAQITWVPKGRN